MKIAVFGNSINSDFISVLNDFFGFLKEKRIEVHLFKPFQIFLTREFDYHPYFTSLFQSHTDFDDSVSFLFSIGGDGTFLQSFQVIRNYDVPVIGVNSGRLGFLADISQEQVTEAITGILNGKYEIIERSLLKVDFEGAQNFKFNYALNEITVVKTDNSSMINTYAYLNNEFLNNYWGDGLIISTPTGSTAYSLSVGGPILTPDSENFVIAPIAPHNLTVRPIVVPDNNEILLRTEGRGSNYRVTLDSKWMDLEFSTSIKINKAPFRLKTLKLPGHTFYSTLRNKLMWGADKRN